jgi:hypothetical protein
MMKVRTQVWSRAWCKSLDCRALGGELARVLKLAIPELVFANLDEVVVLKR